MEKFLTVVFLILKKMTQRSIGVLKYIYEENRNEILINDFENGIWEYLKKVYNHKENKSNIKHFYRPLQFYGFIREFKNKLSLSIEGKRFLRFIEIKEWKKAMKSFINQIVLCSYPNKATKEVEINIDPFKILFKLLIDEGILINKDFIEQRLI